ncbi:sensor histidine kinase [Mucilaginibacter mali]|uniref:Sensor histidine kinase n=1 Tax=Mucilaginibacter mali TaxID=2740462 RepID=A0A7D4PYM6_9SPHI|nr:sensor histidine kinase [Mucilaginibacter mali]QKJ28326.1 sensor histidine kinase [Mucilaginibacter mali]
MAQKNQVANDTAADSVKVKMLVTDGAKLAQNQDRKGANYLLQAIRICDNRSTAFFLKQKVTAMTSIGAYYMFKGRYDSAKYYYTALAKHGTDYKDDFATARSNIGFANIANYQSDYETSVKRNLLALKYFESVRDSIGVATATSNIANSYIRLKQYAKAVDLLEKAIIIYTKKNNAISVANSTANLARAYSGLGNKQKELELKLKAFDMFKKEGYKKGMATVGINLGVYYGKENNITEALKYYNIALQNSWQINDSGNIALLYNNLADLYLKTGNTDKAMFCTDSAWYYAHKNGDRLAQADALLNKAILLHLQGKHTDAVNLTTRYVDLKDSIYTGKMETQVADMEVKYETEKKENQILLLNTANKNKSLQLKNSLLQLNKNQLLITDQKQALTIKELQLKNQNQALQNQRLDAEKKEENIHSLQKQARIQKLELSNQELKLKQRNYIIAAIMLLILGGVLFVYLEYKRNQLKQKAALQQQMMQQQDQLTQAVIEAEEKERRRIAGDLHDGVGQLFSAVKMNLSGLIYRVNIQKEEDRFLAEKTLALVDESCREVRVISHQMMPNMLLRSGIASDVKSFIEKIDSESLKVTVEASGFKDRLESNVETVLYRVIQETVNNVIKHAQASRLNIRLNKDAGGIYADVEDNGIGFDIALIDDFEGIGLKNIVTRIEYLKGTVKFQSAPDRGTVVKIWVPV